MTIKGELFKIGDFYYSPELFRATQKYGSSMIRRMYRVKKIMAIKSKLNSSITFHP
jgi:hypothetical protein